MKKNKKTIKKVFIIILSIVSFSYYKVYISYNNLTANNYNIENKKINNNINLVIISDLHDNELGNGNVDLINKIDLIRPEIILVVGDMLNEYSQNSKIVTDLMKELRESYKVFYSLGNTEEDYIECGKSDLINELKSIGVVVLDKEYKDVKVNDNTIRIGGMYDYAFALNGTKNVNAQNMEDGAHNFLMDFENTNNYKIMMAHRPDSFIFWDATKFWNIDLLVSGHTHGGQIRLPFLGGLYVSDQGWFPKYDKGVFDLNSSKILITSGLGSSKQILPRFNNSPEIVNLKITK